eukprot:EG_transcript_9445
MVPHSLLRRLLWLVVATALLVPGGEAKGTAAGSHGTSGSGYSGAGHGGGHRGYLSGPYAPHARYYVYPYLWYHGPGGHVYYHRSGSTSLTDDEFDDQLDDVMCDRLVFTNVSADWVLFDSRRHCIHQVYGQPGSPENTPLDGILVDVLRWNVSFVPGQYPTVRFAYYPDEINLTAPYFNYSLVLKRLVLQPQNTSLDLQQLFAGHPPFGYPRSFVKMGTRITSIFMAATDPAGPAVSLAFQLSNNFQENNHEFYRPSALKIFLKVGGVTGTGRLALDVDIETLPQRGKLASFAPTAYGARYDPKQQDRVVLGQLPDEELRQRAYVSVGKSARPDDVCVAGTEAHCTTTRLVSLASALVQANVSAGYAGVPLGSRLQLNVGFYDPSEAAPTSSRAASPQPAVAWLLLLAVASALLQR